VKEEKQVSQPGAFAPQGAQTVTVNKSEVNVKEEKGQLVIVSEGVSIGDVVQGLNAVGVTPRDLISVLQAIRRAGALMADLEIM
jgi:flagellar P-ring protein precursor FlgI